MIFPAANPAYPLDNLDFPIADPDISAANRGNSGKRIVSALIVPGSFASRINHSANNSLATPETLAPGASAGVAALWNEENPDNPVVLEPAAVVSLRSTKQPPNDQEITSPRRGSQRHLESVIY